MMRFFSAKALTAAFLTGSLLGAATTAIGATVRGSGIFSDVPAGSYFDAAVGEMYDDGVIKGNPDGTYRPADPVSRAEIAVMLQRFKDSLGETATPASSARSSAPSTSTPSSSPAITSIATNPQGIFRFTTSTFSVNENASTVTISVVRTGGNQGSVAVDYAVAGGSATAGTDFEAASGKLEFASKETSKSFTIRILDDSAKEGTENTTITLKNATNGALVASPGTAVLSIVDDEATTSSTSSKTASAGTSNTNGTLSFAAATYGVLETVGTLTVTVNRVGGTSGTVGVTYATTNGTGVSGEEYTGVSGTLSFAAGETSKTFTIAIADDTSVDGAKTFTVKLTSPTGNAALGTTLATVTIYDSESTTGFGSGALKLSKSSYDVSESAKKVDITVLRTNGTQGAISVNYTTTSGSAGAGSDFTATSGTLTFAAGESSKVVTITVADDSVNETGDYFFFDLSSPTSNATLASTASATINLFD